jgi:hypothetical protein
MRAGGPLPLFAGFPLAVKFILEKCALSIYIVRIPENTGIVAYVLYSCYFLIVSTPCDSALQNSTKLVSATESMFSY